MNKIVIPAILVSITLVAGIFALMPVEKASTVHTTIIANSDDQLRVLHFIVEAGETNFVLIPGNTITSTDAGDVTAVLTEFGGGGTCTLQDQGDATFGVATGAGDSELIDITGDTDWAANDAIEIDTTAGSTCAVSIIITDLND